MGWFEEQVKERRNADQELLEKSYIKLTGVMLGERTARRMLDERIVTQDAIDEILKFFHYRCLEVPDSITSAAEQLDYCLKPYGLTPCLRGRCCSGRIHAVWLHFRVE